MSGKRNKGRGKVEDKKAPLKRFEVSFLSRNIDLRRFAYDFFVYSVSKFRVPRSCICKARYTVNDYGGFRLCPILFRSMIKYQIEHRYELYEMFNSQFESNDLKIYSKVSIVCQNAIQKLLAYETITYLGEIEISLAVVCELILFLYSKNANLYLNDLAKMWCFFVCEKKDVFEKAGGISSMYSKSLKEANDQLDSKSVLKREGEIDIIFQTEKNDALEAFYESFISTYCSSYDDSAKNESLGRTFFELGSQYELEITETFSQKCLEWKEEVGRNKPRRVDDSSRTSAPVSKEGVVGALGNTGLGIRPHEELLQYIGATASAVQTPSHTLVATHPREPPRHRRGSSGHPRRTSTTSNSRSGVEQDFERLSLVSSGTKRLSKENRSVRDDRVATQTQRLLGAIPKKPAKEDISSDLEEDYGACAFENTGLGIRPHEELLQSIGASADATPSQTLVGTHRESQRLLGAIPKKPAKEDSNSDSTSE